ncbi:hypothetical protein Cantr_04503 [Candida viswanathii]|uniref:Uncharacterized protein n=1 Tax=Candida viswanathii TaxID=5486 RepID=A0A367XPE7_9ASCO|nr:hypothetical protein Cantr_04503 [Candida viswanathii]
MNMNVDFFAQMIADASPMLQNPASSNTNGQFISPNPNTFATMNQSNPDFTANAADLSGIDILDFIPAAAVAEQHQIQQQQQQLQQAQQLQQYLQTPKSAVSPKFQLTGGSNFSANPTPVFGAIATFSNGSFATNNSNGSGTFASASVPVSAQFSPITPNVMNFGSQLNLQAHLQQQQKPIAPVVEQTSSTPSSVQAMSNSPSQFSPQQPHYTAASRVSSAGTSIADKSSPTIGLGVSLIEPAPQQTSSIMKITKKQPSPHEQAAFQFQQQVNNEASKSTQTHKRETSTSSSATTTSSKLQTQLNAQLQKLIEQQREKQQQQLLLLKKGEIPKPPELKPKRKSSCRPHKQKRRLQQQAQQQQQQIQQLRKISPPPLQPMTGDSPTTIEVASPELDLNNDLSFANNTSAFMFGGNITAEELLSNDPFEALGGSSGVFDCKGDLLSEFIDFEYEETTTGDLEKSITEDDFDFLNLNKRPSATTTATTPQRPVLKKKSVVSSNNVLGATPTKIAKKTLKKAQSFSAGSTPTFIMNPKLQWTKSQTNEHQRQKSMRRHVSHGHTQSMSDLAGADCNDIVQGMPVFTLSNHYLFVYETADTIYQDESNEDSSTQTTPRKQQNNPMVSEVDLLKNLESGLGEFKLDLPKRR